MTYDELSEKTVGELREIAKGLPEDKAVQGYSQLNKEHLLPLLAKALGIHVEHRIVGIDKPAIKARMRELKKERNAALEARDPEKLREVRRRLHSLNHQIRSHVARG
jgi:hypothetical protein